MFNRQFWKEFRLADIFEFSNCKCNVARDLSDGDDCFYIGAKKNDNGVMRRVAHDEVLITKGNCVVFICDGQGSVGYTNYMDKDFIGSSTLSVGRNSNLNEYSGMFLVSVLDLERPKYSFGRKYRTKLKQTTIMLPATRKGDIDWVYMENYIRSIANIEIPVTNISKSNAIDLNFNDWKDFRIEDLFKFYKGKRLTKDDMLDGSVNFIGAISDNNGVRQHIDATPIFQPNCITVNYNGSVGEAFYQYEPFWASDDVNVLYAYGWELNKYIAMFIVTVIKANRYRFSYGRKWTLEKMKDSIIKLPTNIDGSPNWEHMESYIKSLPYSDKI